MKLTFVFVILKGRFFVAPHGLFINSFYCITYGLSDTFISRKIYAYMEHKKLFMRSRNGKFYH